MKCDQNIEYLESGLRLETTDSLVIISDPACEAGGSGLESHQKQIFIRLI